MLQSAPRPHYPRPGQIGQNSNCCPAGTPNAPCGRPRDYPNAGHLDELCSQGSWSLTQWATTATHPQLGKRPLCCIKYFPKCIFPSLILILIAPSSIFWGSGFVSPISFRCLKILTVWNHKHFSWSPAGQARGFV